MKKLVIIFFMSLSFNFMTLAQNTYTITVDINNIGSTDGAILLAIFDSEETFLEKGLKEARLTPEKGTVTYKFEDIIPGIYTISAVHDLNDNGGLDTNFIGIPTEPYGVSKDGKQNFGPPSYKDAVFQLDKSDVNIIINL